MFSLEVAEGVYFFSHVYEAERMPIYRIIGRADRSFQLNFKWLRNLDKSAAASISSPPGFSAARRNPISTVHHADKPCLAYI
jgi:hypothetical protein